MKIEYLNRIPLKLIIKAKWSKSQKNLRLIDRDGQEKRIPRNKIHRLLKKKPIESILIAINDYNLKRVCQKLLECDPAEERYKKLKTKKERISNWIHAQRGMGIHEVVGNNLLIRNPKSSRRTESERSRTFSLLYKYYNHYYEDHAYEEYTLNYDERQLIKSKNFNQYVHELMNKNQFNSYFLKRDLDLFKESLPRETPASMKIMRLKLLKAPPLFRMYLLRSLTKRLYKLKNCNHILFNIPLTSGKKSDKKMIVFKKELPYYEYKDSPITYSIQNLPDSFVNYIEDFVPEINITIDRFVVHLPI